MANGANVLFQTILALDKTWIKNENKMLKINNIIE
jgi:hypothetical protein